MAARAPHRPDPPAELGAAGAALWADFIGDIEVGWELDIRELHFLRRACIIEDRLLDLDSAVDRDGVTTKGSRGQVVEHPALGEGRQLTLAQFRLLSAIQTVNPATSIKAATPASLRGRKAAESRWGKAS